MKQENPVRIARVRYVLTGSSFHFVALEPTPTIPTAGATTTLRAPSTAFVEAFDSMQMAPKDKSQLAKENMEAVKAMNNPTFGILLTGYLWSK